MKHIIATIIALFTLSVSAVAGTIEQANIVDGNTYKPAIKVDGVIYATPYRITDKDELEAWVLSNLGIAAKADATTPGFEIDPVTGEVI